MGYWYGSSDAHDSWSDVTQDRTADLMNFCEACGEFATDIEVRCVSRIKHSCHPHNPSCHPQYICGKCRGTGR